MEKYNINNRNWNKISSIQRCCVMKKIIFFKVDLISKINFLASEKCYLRLTLLTKSKLTYASQTKSWLQHTNKVYGTNTKSLKLEYKHQFQKLWFSQWLIKCIIHNFRISIWFILNYKQSDNQYDYYLQIILPRLVELMKVSS